MNPVPVPPFSFDFATQVLAEQYEKSGTVTPGWPEGVKVVDIVAHDVANSGVAWLIEAKDFRTITRQPRPANLQDLPQTMLAKVTGTLTGLTAIAAIAGHTLATHAQSSLAKPTTRAVLHLEPHPRNGTHSFLFPVEFVLDVKQKLDQVLNQVAPNPLVLSIATTPRAGVPWTVQ